MICWNEVERSQQVFSQEHAFESDSIENANAGHGRQISFLMGLSQVTA